MNKSLGLAGLVLAGAGLVGCGNAPILAERQIAYIESQDVKYNPRKMEQTLTPKQKQAGVDLLQRVGEYNTNCGDCIGFHLLPGYSTKSEEVKERITLQVAAKYNVDQLANFVTNYKELLGGDKAAVWKKEATKKDIVAILLWLSAAHSSSSGTEETSPFNNNGGQERVFEDIIPVGGN